jgi:hypothetical protein
VNLPAGCRAIGTIHGTVITATDFPFARQQLSAAKGRLVAFVLNDAGIEPHTIRIAGADVTFDTADDAVSVPAVSFGGEQATVAWQTPNVTAAIPYRCDIHPVDMTGTINLK